MTWAERWARLVAVLAEVPKSGGMEVLRHLAWLRWVALAGQAGALLFAWGVLGFELPWFPLVGGMFLTSFSNHWLPDGARVRGGRRVTVAIVTDVLILTWMLYWTGGVNNPFMVFYLLHVVLAGMLLSLRGMWLVGLLGGCCFALILCWHQPFRGPAEWVQSGLLTYPLHRVACGVGLLLSGVVLGWLVHQMRCAQERVEEELREAALRGESCERFKSLATLSAGVAHELGTPLGTIAIVSRELERGLGEGNPEWRADAKLIREEVERCRQILRRLDVRSTGGTGSPVESVVAVELVMEVQARLSSQWRERLWVEDKCGERRLDVLKEPLLQAMVVLVENACEADGAGHPVFWQLVVEEGFLVCRVIDQGRGMNEAVRRRAGEPYFTTKSRDGTGLGLFLVKTLLAETGGELSLLPGTNGGTCAVVKIPLLEP